MFVCKQEFGYFCGVMRILVAPLNWGLGHATRCIDLVNRLLARGDEVVLGGDGISLRRLRMAFPSLRVVELAPLELRYSNGRRQTWAMLRALPQIVRASIADHRLLQEAVRREGIDEVVSDNRFGCFVKGVRCVYMTHQLYIRLPRGWRWAEGMAYRLHRLVWKRYDEVWVPDYEDERESLSGALSHRRTGLPSASIRYIGPLSRLTPSCERDTRYDVVALLSGLEPQRTVFERTIRERYADSEERVLIIRGRIGEPQVEWHNGNMTVVPQMDDSSLVRVLQGARKIICRSGYSTVMDLAAIGVLDKAEWIPTPGQPEQEYLAEHLNRRLHVTPSL